MSPCNAIGLANTKTTTGTHRNPSSVDATLLTSWHIGAHHVAGLKTLHKTYTFGCGTRKAKLIDATHLTGLASGGLDDERL
jgi:hypothetical protein